MNIKILFIIKSLELALSDKGLKKYVKLHF